MKRRPRREAVKTQDVVVMYEQQRLSLGKIALLVGMSRAGILKRLRSAGVDTAKSRRWQAACDYCGRELALTRVKLKSAERHYCNADEYYASLEGEKYKPWRQGSRLARALVAQRFALQPDHVVHHKDGDQSNNDRSNLLVFADQAAHMAHHRGRNVAPLWDGAGS